MNTTKLLTGTVVGTIVAMIGGFLLYGMVLSEYMQENASQIAEPNMLWLAIGHIAFALLITYIFLQWAGISTAASGAKAGALIALLAGLAFNFIYLGTSNHFTGGVATVLLDAVGMAVVWGITGAAIGWVLGRGDS